MHHFHRLGPFGRLGAALHWTTASSDEVKKSKISPKNYSLLIEAMKAHGVTEAP